ncbi:MAG: threonylcarbamoyl-AMP synthase [Actinomycetales bacterium]|nr:threonylcarbamoyl-AMP synthase [Actinomycetales bacterium]
MLIADCQDAQTRERGLQAAATAARRGDLVLMPVETSYALVTDAFSLRGAQHVRQVKGQVAGMPLPILVPGASTVMGLAMSIPQAARDLMAAFWPGLLALMLNPQPTLVWDQPDGHPVLVRMPLHPVALELLGRTGPLIATSANAAGLPSPMTVADAVAQLGEAFTVCLDAGPSDPWAEPSTVVDVTGPVPVVRRPGSVTLEEIRQVCPEAVSD